MTTTYSNNYPNNNQQSNRKKRIVVIIFFLIIGLLIALTSNGQTHYNRDNRIYHGFDVSFGTRTFKFNSNLPELNNAYAGQAGGQVGLLVGNDVWKVRLGILGYYSQTSRIAGQMDVYENNVSANFYPLSLLLKKSSAVAPYLIGGISSDRTKLHGHYASKEEGAANYSSLSQPYIGSINSLSSTFGAGVDFKIIDSFDFVHVYAEATYGMNITQHTKFDALANTKTGNQMNVNMGLRFGGHRLKSSLKK